MFLQQAETVRLIQPPRSGDEQAVRGDDAEWQPLAVTDMEGGELVLVRETERGRHVGKLIEAAVTES